MSYRVTVNGLQLFGNNEDYTAWNDFIRSQGIEIREDSCYDGEIHDFHGAMLACEAVVKELIEERRADAAKLVPRLEKYHREHPDNEPVAKELRKWTKSYFDFTNYEGYVDNKLQTIFDACWEIATSGYVFLPFTLWMACRDQLADPEPCIDADGVFRVRKYQFKPGMSAHVHAG